MSSIMPKALCVLLGFAAIGAGVLHERQQNLELRYRAAQLHREIQKTQAQLWQQQLQIAAYTSPQVLQAMSAGIHPQATVDFANDVENARE